MTEKWYNKDMKEVEFKNLSKQYQELLLSAEKAGETAYIPYSGFAVGAALLAVNGKIITGSNVENAVYSLSFCAERSALVRANALGERRFKALAIIAKSGKEMITPCGSCRQVLFEFSRISGIDSEIIMSNPSKKKIVIARISELLPLGFGPKNMGLDVKKIQ